MTEESGRRLESQPARGQDAGDLDALRREVDHEQVGEARQPSSGPDVDG